jgi:hypothetical protein
MPLPGSQLASLYFASYLSPAGPARLDTGASQQVFADSQELLGGFTWTEREAARSPGYIPILAISW